MGKRGSSRIERSSEDEFDQQQSSKRKRRKRPALEAPAPEVRKDALTGIQGNAGCFPSSFSGSLSSSSSSSSSPSPARAAVTTSSTRKTRKRHHDVDQDQRILDERELQSKSSTVNLYPLPNVLSTRGACDPEGLSEASRPHRKSTRQDRAVNCHSPRVSQDAAALIPPNPFIFQKISPAETRVEHAQTPSAAPAQKSKKPRPDPSGITVLREEVCDRDLIDYALFWATTEGKFTVVQEIFKEPRLDPARDRYASLCIAAQNGHLDIVEFFLQDDRVDPAEATKRAFLAALRTNQTKVLQYLSSNYELAAIDPKTLLEKAREKCSLGVIQVLLELPSTDVSIKGYAVFKEAKKMENIKLLKLLVQHRTARLDEVLRCLDCHDEKVSKLMDRFFDELDVQVETAHQILEQGHRMRGFKRKADADSGKTSKKDARSAAIMLLPSSCFTPDIQDAEKFPSFVTTGNLLIFRQAGGLGFGIGRALSDGKFGSSVQVLQFHALNDKEGGPLKPPITLVTSSPSKRKSKSSSRPAIATEDVSMSRVVLSWNLDGSPFEKCKLTFSVLESMSECLITPGDPEEAIKEVVVLE